MKITIEKIPGYTPEKLEEFKKGGWIKNAINPAHKGYCTPMTKSTCTGHRRALALTFKKHHGFHEDGGSLETYAEGGDMESPCISCSGYAMCGGHLKKHDLGGELQGSSEWGYPLNTPLYSSDIHGTQVSTATDPVSAPTTIAPQTIREQYSPYRGSNLPLYMGIGTGLANLGLAASVKTPTPIQPVTITPGKIDSGSIRRDILENAGRSRANRLAALRGSGLSPAQYLSAVSAGDSDINQATANTIRQNEFETQMKNIQMNQAAQEANAKAINEANLYNAQQKYGAQAQRRSYITNALQNVGQGVQSYMSQREALDVANAMSPYMQIVRDKYGNIRRVPKTGI